MGLVVKLQTMQQLANHISDHFSNQKSIVIGVYIGIELVIELVINCQVAFKLDHQVANIDRAARYLSFLNSFNVALSER